MRIFLLLAVASVLSACAVPSKHSKEQGVASVSLNTLYDVHVLSSQTKKAVSIQALAHELRDVDVVFIGEYHGNHGSHWLQAQLQAALYQQRPQQMVSMEQFSRDQQPVLNQYLKGKQGEVSLLKQAGIWPNYKASYRPVVEFAKQHQLPVIAANAPAGVVRCIGRQGEGYLKKLSKQQRQQLAKQPFNNDAAYQQAFQKIMHQPSGKQGSSSARLSNSYLAQLSRDNTMAESIAQAMKTAPDAQLIHLNGAFHSDQGLGTVALLKQRLPHLKVKVISPVKYEDGQIMAALPYQQGDYIYLVQPQPKQYVSDTERADAFRAMFAKASKKVCQ